MATMFEPDLRAYLLDNADLQAAISNRLFYNSAPQNERRSRVIIRVSSQQTRTVDKGLVNDWTSDLNIDALAPTYREAATAASALAAALGNIRNVVEGETILTYVKVHPAEDIPSMPVEGSAKPVFGKNLRAIVHWREVRPGEELPIDPAARYKNMIFAPDQCMLL